MATILRSSIAEIRAHEHGLCEMNWAEAHPGEPFALDWQFYETAESHGAVDALAAWDGDAMIGYSVAMHHVHPQSGERSAVSCGIYVRPGPGAGLLLRRLVEATDDVTRAGGASVYRIDDRVDGRLGRLLRRIGFSATHTYYARKL